MVVNFMQKCNWSQNFKNVQIGRKKESYISKLVAKNLCPREMSFAREMAWKLKLVAIFWPKYGWVAKLIDWPIWSQKKLMDKMVAKI